MNGNVPVRFLGEDAFVTTHPYPTHAPTPTDRKQGRVTERSNADELISTGEEEKILLRRKVCAYLTGRLMGDPKPTPMSDPKPAGP
jgi:hypothetical protein